MAGARIPLFSPMSNNLPVPSPGALRTLRHLAFGTSCTVGLGAGLLTEDRRRRIHAARIVRDNGNKLRSAKQYHNGGAAITEVFEDPVVVEWDRNLHMRRKKNEEEVSAEDKHSIIISTSNTHIDKAPPLKSNSTLGSVSWEANQVTRYRQPLPQAKKDSSPGYDRQLRLAKDVKKLLVPADEVPSSPQSVQAAARRFIEAFEEGMDINSLEPELMEAAIELSAACRSQSRFYEAEKILEIVLGYKGIQEHHFWDFKPWEILLHMLRKSKVAGATSSDEATLRKAISIYTTKFNNRPRRKFGTGWLKLGRKLCAETCDREMFGLTKDIYSYMELSIGDAINPAAAMNIIALHGTKLYKKAIEAFLQGPYRLGPTHQLEFYRITTVAMKCVRAVQFYHLQRDIMRALLQIAERLKLRVSTTAILMTLSNDWMVHKDITRSIRLFDEIEPKLHLTDHPVAPYALIIRNCIEAGDEFLARNYEKRARHMERLTPTVSKREEGPGFTRIAGQFALAKAMRGDWKGVRADFAGIASGKPDKEEFSQCFDTVLGVFAKSHGLTETEEFVREYVESFKLKLTTEHSNIILEQYLKSKELGAVSRWLDFMSTVNTRLDAKFLNTLFRACHKEWKFTHKEIFWLYEAMTHIDHFDERTIDNTTISLLRNIALSSTAVDPEVAAGRLNYLDNIVKVPSNYEKSSTERMTEALYLGKAKEALAIYDHAIANNLPLHRFSLSHAIQASLKLTPHDSSHALALLRDRRKDQDLAAPLHQIFAHRLAKDEVCENESISAATRDALAILEKNDIPPLQELGFINYPMSILVYKNRFQEAIDFWDTMTYRTARSPVVPRLEDLTLHLRAYIGLRNEKGLDWVLRMIVANKMIVDQRFKAILKNERRLEGKFLLNKYQCIPDDAAAWWFRAIQRVLSIAKTMRLEIQEERKIAFKEMLVIMEKAMQLQGRAPSLDFTEEERKQRARKPQIYHDYEETGTTNEPMTLWADMQKDEKELKSRIRDLGFWSPGAAAQMAKRK
ncbi:hypothetical protein BJ878DRAFT_504379 [Calycina marina]|uniref:Uncharacterized protein n=1 Tax=Calycina marina TaxID=1763456 RepID=A0A9P7Z454_9HELO|nr:hypothetical protein BJ878DRAFT_504379 [Calycina marina]